MLNFYKLLIIAIHSLRSPIGCDDTLAHDNNFNNRLVNYIVYYSVIVDCYIILVKYSLKSYYISYLLDILNNI